MNKPRTVKRAGLVSLMVNRLIGRPTLDTQPCCVKGSVVAAVAPVVAAADPAVAKAAVAVADPVVAEAAVLVRNLTWPLVHAP